MGRNRAERTGEVSSQGSTNSSAMEPNMQATPPSFDGTDRRMA